MGKTDIEFTIADFVAAGAVSLDWTAVALDWCTVERVTENDNTLGEERSVWQRDESGKW